MKPLLILFCCFHILLNSHAYQTQNGLKWPSNNHHDSSAFQRRVEDTTVEGLQKLTTSSLQHLYSSFGQNSNIVFSPISIWTVLVLLLEASSGRTEKELKVKLSIFSSSRNGSLSIIRSRQKKINKVLADISNSDGPTEFSSLNFAIGKATVSKQFLSILSRIYDGKYFKFAHPKKGLFSVMVNSWASDKSNGKIASLISEDELNDLVVLIGNAVYFKSQWKYPFFTGKTISKPFENGFGKTIGKVPMMHVMSQFSWGYSKELKSNFVEIPYADNATSMIVVLPKSQVSLQTVISKMKNRSLREIIPADMEEEMLQLFLPKFRVTSNIDLNGMLKKDLPSMFDSKRAELPRLGKNIYVTKVLHKAQIENTEEGTTASAITSAHLGFKTIPAEFRANRPFIYFINDIKTRTVLFCGTFTKPIPENSKTIEPNNTEGSENRNQNGNSENVKITYSNNLNEY